MSLIKWRNDEGRFPALGSFFDDFWDRDFFKGFATGTTLPAVNIKETEDMFSIEVAAPGLEKDDFTVEVNNGMLTVSAEKEAEMEEKDGEEVTRREFNFTSFRRALALPDSVKEDGITAKYKNGVLFLTLPKMAEAKTKPRKTVKIQ